MRSPPKRPLAFVAEYHFGDDNVLTATHHEESRLRNEERVRNAKSVLRLEGLIAGGDASPLPNAKKMQQEQDRLDEIDQHNFILLQRLERIHHHLPKQFDVSHHCEAVQNAPRASNAALRRRQHDKIELENERIQKRLHNVKGSFNLRQLAADAERHHYFSDQLSKIGRRRKVQAAVKQLTNLSAQKHDQYNHPEAFYVYDHDDGRPRGTKHHASGNLDVRDVEEDYDDDESIGRVHDDARLREGPPPHWKLPPVSVARKYAPLPTRSPTLTNTSKAISASDLLRGLK